MKKLIIIILFILPALKGSAQATYVAIQDTRTVNNPPSDFKSRLALDFKENSVIGVANADRYAAVLTIAPWHDFSGGQNHQLSFNASGVFYRVGNHGAPEWQSWRKVLVESSNGNVGIGTPSPTHKLSVNGNIRAHEIKVETANWPDYVFAKDYKLTSLQETEFYIKKNGHLPGFPSAMEVEKNGVDLGEMNAKLLQKIEELTLHLIQQAKANEMQHK